MKEALGRLARGEPLDGAAMEKAVGLVMDGAATPAQIGAFLGMLQVRGETDVELVAAVRAMRARAVPVPCGGELLDTCGTGGDGLGTFNISTAVSFVAAAAGVRVAKHGNRAASGNVGAADVLEALGADIALGPEEALRCIEEVGIAFLFAPRYHRAARHAAGPRREIGFRTLFNLLGPLSNPAGATHQLLGLFAGRWMEPVARALSSLGCRRALIVHGEDGADEISLASPTRTIELRTGIVSRGRIVPEEVGLRRCKIPELSGGDVAANAELLRTAIAGGAGPRSDVVALNAGAALYVAGRADTVAQGVSQAADLMRSGAATKKLDAFVELTRSLGS